jgi:hypothetical protein
MWEKLFGLSGKLWVNSLWKSSHERLRSGLFFFSNPMVELDFALIPLPQSDPSP